MALQSELWLGNHYHNERQPKQGMRRVRNHNSKSSSFTKVATKFAYNFGLRTGSVPHVVWFVIDDVVSVIFLTVTGLVVLHFLVYYMMSTSCTADCNTHRTPHTTTHQSGSATTCGCPVALPTPHCHSRSLRRQPHEAPCPAGPMNPCAHHCPSLVMTPTCPGRGTKCPQGWNPCRPSGQGTHVRLAGTW